LVGMFYFFKNLANVSEKGSDNEKKI